MRTTYRLLLMLIMVAFVATGCSKNDEDVDQLEQQMKEMDTDSTVVKDTVAPAVDTAQPSVGDAEAVVEEEPAKAMPRRPESSGYTVQVAGCEDQDYAQYLVDVYQKRGYEPYVTSYVKEGQTYYRVRIGIFQSKAEADALSDELKDKYSIEPWVDIN